MASDGLDRLAYRVVRASTTPLLLLDHDLRVLAVSKGYVRTFEDEGGAEGRPLTEITGGAWTEARVQALLEHVRLGDPGAVIDTTVVCPQGKRQVRVGVEPTPGDGSLVLSIEDLTDTLARDARLQETAALLHEAQHRTANNLAMISSILSMKARSVVSDETRSELESARRRILAMATSEKHLQLSGPETPTEVRPYLQALCRQLGASLIGDARKLTISLRASPGTQPRRTAVIIGLVVTELVINALKYAYPNGRGGTILVEYSEDAAGWCAAVSDDGAGLKQDAGRRRGGLDIVSALAAQLKADLRIESTSKGLRVELCCVETA